MVGADDGKSTCATAGAAGESNGASKSARVKIRSKAISDLPDTGAVATRQSLSLI
jgi:hypothetical protein